MLKFFSDRSCVPPGVPHTEMLYPFWGNPAAPVPDVVSGDYAGYMRSAPEYLELTSLEEADIAVLPFGWESVAGDRAARAAAERFVHRASEADKPVAVFFFSDSDAPVPLPATVFRTSIASRSRGPREFALPAWNEDIVAAHCRGQLPVRKRPAVPVVGFCGRVPRPSQVRQAVAAIAGRDRAGANRLRAAALDAVRASKAVESRLIERDFFFGGLATTGNPASESEHRRWRRDFVDTMVDTDYALCVRGMGNFSYRWFEALCCGRIPVVVDTDCVLPFDGDIPWREYGVWVNPGDLRDIGERVAAFNAGLSDGAFVDMQRECRRLWETLLSPEGFFRNLHRHFPRVESSAHDSAHRAPSRSCR